jgi:hypothetical protein
MMSIYILLRSSGPLARRERRACRVLHVRSEQRSQRACGPQREGARRRADICFVAAPRRCPRIACVAAPRIFPPGARAKMQTLFIDRPLARETASKLPWIVLISVTFQAEGKAVILSIEIIALSCAIVLALCRVHNLNELLSACFPPSTGFSDRRLQRWFQCSTYYQRRTRNARREDRK